MKRKLEKCFVPTKQAPALLSELKVLLHSLTIASKGVMFMGVSHIHGSTPRWLYPNNLDPKRHTGGYKGIQSDLVDILHLVNLTPLITRHMEAEIRPSKKCIFFGGLF